MAHQKMFAAVTDALESVDGDHWLLAVTDTFASAPEEAGYSLRDVLVAVLQDYELSSDERRRVRRLISDVPERAELAELELPPEEMARAVFDVLEGVILFVQTYAERLESTYGED